MNRKLAAFAEPYILYRNDAKENTKLYQTPVGKKNNNFFYSHYGDAVACTNPIGKTGN